MAAAALMAGCNPDPIENYGFKTLTLVHTFSESYCIGFFYDLNDDKKIDLFNDVSENYVPKVEIILNKTEKDVKSRSREVLKQAFDVAMSSGFVKSNAN